MRSGTCASPRCWSSFAATSTCHFGLGEAAASNQAEMTIAAVRASSQTWGEQLAAGQAARYVSVAQLAARHGVTPQAV
jgi:hypothetical protein